ncbi:hypothetical protein GQ85_11015 [Rhodococcus rhodochrous]|nr:hypothetical protein GQ85_11015 [Rhodococcus rhodochrous]
MSAPLASALGRDWKLEILDGATWVHVKGLSSVTAVFAGAMQDDSDIDSDGYASQISTGQAFSIPFSGKRKGDDTVGFVDDPGQNLLRTKGRKTGALNIVTARIYRRDDLPDAYQAECAVEWTDSAASDPNALQEFSGTLWGRGKPEEITKPGSATTVKTFTVTGAPTGGTWTITADGNVTGLLARNVTALQLQSALEALPNVGEGNVLVSGTATAGLVATFSVALTTVTAAHTFTGGTTPDVTVA